MTTICSFKKQPVADNSLFEFPINNYFRNNTDIGKLSNDRLQEVNGGANIKYQNKIDTSIIPYVYFNELDDQLEDGMKAIATASIVIKVSDTNYKIIYPSFASSEEGQDTYKVGPGKIVFKGVAEEDLPNLPELATLSSATVNKWTFSRESVNYDLYFIDSSVEFEPSLVGGSMTGGAETLIGNPDDVREVENILKNIKNGTLPIVPVVNPTPVVKPVVKPEVKPVVKPVVNPATAVGFKKIGNGELRSTTIGYNHINKIEKNNLTLEEAKEYCKTLPDCIGFIIVDEAAQRARQEEAGVPARDVKPSVVYFSNDHLPLQRRARDVKNPKVYVKDNINQIDVFAKYENKGFAKILDSADNIKNNLSLNEAMQFCRRMNRCIGFIHVDKQTQIARGNAITDPYNIYITNRDIPILKLESDPKNAEVYIDNAFFTKVKGGIIDKIVKQSGGGTETGIYLKKNKLNEIYTGNINSQSYKINYI